MVFMTTLTYDDCRETVELEGGFTTGPCRRTENKGARSGRPSRALTTLCETLLVPVASLALSVTF